MTPDTCHLTCDTWHVTHAMLHMACNTWSGVNILSKFPRSYGLDLGEWMKEWLNELVTKVFVEQPRLHRVCLADPGKARGCSINSLVILWFIQWVSQSFPPTALRRRHAQTVGVSTSNYKIDYVIMIKNYLNPKGYKNPFSGSKVTAILLKG